MANNKYIHSRKIENFLEVNVTLNTSKDKGEKANFRNSCKKFKITDAHLTNKGKKG